MHRGGRGFQDNFHKSEIVPLRAPLSTLFDTDHLVTWAATHNATFHRVQHGSQMQLQAPSLLAP